jgi:NADH-quinone oxidoreductase subunit J
MRSIVSAAQGLATFLAENWRVLLPVVLGAAAVYLLLPRPRGRSIALGALLGAAALVTAGVFLLPVAGRVRPEAILFYGFAGLALLAGGVLITQRNPARAAIAFAVVVLSTCGLFLLQAAPFLMAATVIIYAGAIIVTFLFVLMLAHQGGPSDADDRSREPLLATVAGFALLGCLVLVLLRTYDHRTLDHLTATAEAAAQEPTAETMAVALGDPRAYVESLDREAKRLAGTDAEPPLAAAISQLDVALNQRERSPDRLRPALVRLAKAGREARTEFGALRPPSNMKLSGYAGAPPAATPPADDSAEPAPPRSAQPLPAENVAALGRTLFSDHLLAVELGGTLLLVATIGTIAIAGRRTGGAA